ncbi:ABC transporter substrate-binding protein [Paenibacillus piri]|uniref:Sugar ABC transporter substrate-binding protein n=1 Tax=Paenibacillus piri TaxID=2547395 RepID=A0A4V6PIJ5_9BACL|nr:sugar ABC transporter substrate-binding protein [Paenibacillus piri]TDF98744.1 sugar ABC transporter substrate-binding protein [Paenibacillus piri]
MFKKGFTIGMAAILAVALSACSGGEAAQKPAGKNDTQEKVTLRFGFYGGEARHKKYTEMIADFEKKNPNIKVEQEFADQDPFYDKLATQAAGNNLPDVISMKLSRYGDYANRNQLLPLDDFVQSKTIDTSDFSPRMLDAGKVNGKIIMVANGNVSKGLFYNTELFKKANVQPPKFDASWDEFAAKGAEFKKAVNNPNIYFADDPTGITPDSDIFGYFLRQRGKDVYSKEGKLGFEKQDMIDWFNYWDKLRKDGIIPPAPVVAEYANKSAQESMLVKGVVALTVSAGGANQLGIYQSFVKDQLEAGRIPTLPNGKHGEDLGGIFFSIAAKSKHPKEAAQFINYLLNDVDGAKIFKEEFGPSPSKKMQEAVKPVLSPANIKVDEFQQKVAEFFTIPNNPPAGNSEIYKQITITSQAIGFGKKTVEKAVDDFFNEANKILK